MCVALASSNVRNVVRRALHLAVQYKASQCANEKSVMKEDTER